MLEIRFHGRGGQGAVTAANVLVAAALKDGNRGVQSFPLFGAERRGAPVKAFARISDSEIDLRSEIYRPDIVVVLDPVLVTLVDITEGLKEDGTLVVNTRAKPGSLEVSERFRVATVDAAGIAIENDLLVSGIPVVNTPILGALPRVSAAVSLGAIQAAIKEQWKGEAGEKNARAAEQAYKLAEVNF